MHSVQGASQRVVQLGVAASGQGCRYTSMRVAETSPQTESSPKLLLGREKLEADVVCKLPADNQGQHSRGGGVSSHTPQRERQVAQQGRERCRGCCGGGWGRAKASQQVTAMADRPAKSSRRSQAGVAGHASNRVSSSRHIAPQATLARASAPLSLAQLKLTRRCPGRPPRRLPAPPCRRRRSSGCSRGASRHKRGGMVGKALRQSVHAAPALHTHNNQSALGQPTPAAHMPQAMAHNPMVHKHTAARQRQRSGPCLMSGCTCPKHGTQPQAMVTITLPPSIGGSDVALA